MVRGILVTHGELGRELVRTAESILGPQEGTLVVSNTGASLASLSGRLQEALANDPAPAILFVDLFGGSWGHVCRALTDGDRPVAIFTGVNLPMLLEFFANRGRVSLEELKERLLRKGRDGVQAL